jgi:hypothetical protein
MKVDELLSLADGTFKTCLTILSQKNKDYSKGEDALRNFKMVEVFNLTDSPTGICVRLCDKFSRIANLLKSGPAVKDESIEDTILDVINYAILLKACLQENKKNATDK